MSEKNLMSQKPQIQKKHPTGYQEDLNPDGRASQNLGQYTVAGDPRSLNALEIKPLKLKLQRVFSDDIIAQIDIVPPGVPLKQGAVYLDLMDSDSPPFTAHERMKARDDQWLIPKNETPFDIWNTLKGHYIT